MPRNVCHILREGETGKSECMRSVNVFKADASRLPFAMLRLTVSHGTETGVTWGLMIVRSDV